MIYRLLCDNEKNGYLVKWVEIRTIFVKVSHPSKSIQNDLIRTKSAHLVLFPLTLILLHSLLGALVSPPRARDNFSSIIPNAKKLLTSHLFFHSQTLKSFTLYFCEVISYFISKQETKNDFY